MNPEGDSLEVLNVKKIAQILNMDESNIRRKIHAGELPALKRGKSYSTTDRALEYYHFIEEQRKALGKLKTKAKTISFVNHKGGCSKTTSAYTIAGLLSRLGNKVLMVDMDPQGNSSQTALTPNMSEDGIFIPYKHTIKDVLLEKSKGNSISEAQLATAIHPSLFGFDMIPCDLSLNNILKEIESSPFKEVLLRESLKELEEEYDYIIIDTPPTLSFSVIASMIASDYIILVTTPEAFSILGIEQTLNLIDSIKKQNSLLSNPKNLRILGTIISKVELSTNVAKYFIEQTKEFGQQHDLPIFEDFVTKNIKIPETQALQVLLADYDPLSTASLAYFNIALQIDETVKKERIKEKLS